MTADGTSSTGLRADNAEVRHESTATPDQIWAVLADGWAYAGWVVGASRIRLVDTDWPAVGARVHHSVGSWPLLLNDETEVLESRAPTLLRLQAKGRPFGEARVRLEIAATPTGSTITIIEDATHGPGRLVPKPLRQLLLVPRNRESLRRLAYLAERGSR